MGQRGTLAPMTCLTPARHAGATGGVLVLAVVLLLGSAGASSGCGGGGGSTDRERASTSGGEAAGRVREPESYRLHVEIPLEAGHLVLGSDDPARGPISLSVRGAENEVVLFGCDFLSARNLRGSMTIGPARFQQGPGDLTSVTAGITSDLLRRLLGGPRPMIVTCDEELPLTREGIALAQQFLEGRTEIVRERFETRTISLHGLQVQLSIGDQHPDIVEFELQVLESDVPVDECDSLLAMGAGRTFQLATLELTERERGERVDTLAASVRRSCMQWLVAGMEAQLVVCQEPWLLDEWALENVRSLVGAPETSGAEPPELSEATCAPIEESDAD